MFDEPCRRVRIIPGVGKDHPPKDDLLRRLKLPVPVLDAGYLGQLLGTETFGR